VLVSERDMNGIGDRVARSGGAIDPLKDTGSTRLEPPSEVDGTFGLVERVASHHYT